MALSYVANSILQIGKSGKKKKNKKQTNNKNSKKKVSIDKKTRQKQIRVEPDVIVSQKVNIMK